MKQTKEILGHLEGKYKSIGYYYTVIDIIESKVESNPDISIESCKSLLEGISKFILGQLDDAYDDKKKTDFPRLFRTSLNNISEHCDMMEQDFVLRACTMIEFIGEIRNKRGDISHGKLSPKIENSDSLLSNLVMQMTDGLAYYILKCFSTIEIVQVLQYEDNPEFNNLLDEENSYGNLSYSKALFSQDVEAYKQELLNYIDSKE